MNIKIKKKKQKKEKDSIFFNVVRLRFAIFNSAVVLKSLHALEHHVRVAIPCLNLNPFEVQVARQDHHNCLTINPLARLNRVESKRQ